MRVFNLSRKPLIIPALSEASLPPSTPALFSLSLSARKNKFTDVDSSASQVRAYRGTSSRVLSYVYPAFNRRRRRQRYLSSLSLSCHPFPRLFPAIVIAIYLYGELRYSPESRERLTKWSTTQLSLRRLRWWFKESERENGVSLSVVISFQPRLIFGGDQVSSYF